MLRQRLYFGFWMILAAVAVLAVDGWFSPYFPTLFVASGVMVWIASSELCSLFQQSPLRIQNRLFACVGSVLIAWANWLPILLPASFQSHLPNVEPTLAVFVAMGMAGFMLTAWRFRQPGDSALSIAGYLLVFFYIGVLSSFLFQLRWLSLQHPNVGSMALTLAIFTPKICDTGAYFAGRWFGRNRIVPILSPGKTLEGYAGGLVFAVVATWVIGRWPVEGGSPCLLSPLGVVLFALAVGYASQIGDLMESLLKRDCGLKDASSSIPGFGGFLDVADSVLFSSPVAYFLLVVMHDWVRA